MKDHLDPLISLLQRVDGVHEFVAATRRGTRVEVQELAGTPVVRHGADERTADLVIYRDVRRGRGSARLRLTGQDEPERARELIADAAERAAGSLGPGWRLPPPAAPARVDIADPDLAADPMQAAETVRRRVAELLAPGSEITAVLGTELQAKRMGVTILTRDISVFTSRGFVHHYSETRLDIALSLGATAGVTQTVELSGRRLADIDLANTLLRAARQMRDRQGATLTQPGMYDLLVSESALLPRRVTDMSRVPGAAGNPAQYAWLAPLVAQADARLVRQGLAQYLPGQSVYRGARPTGELLTVSSNGAAPFGLLSRPVGDQGEPVRNFSLIESGMAAGLALDLEEAALRGTTANGGVRNLDIRPGTTPVSDLRAPGEHPVLEAVDLDWLEIDTLSGGFVAALGLGYLTTPQGRGAPVTGGLVRGNLHALWARARLAEDTVKTGWYHGPRAIRFDRVQIL